MDSVTEERVRDLTPEDLGLSTTASPTLRDPAEGSVPSPPLIAEGDDLYDLYLKVRAALDMGFAGVVLSGPPGTGKSYSAERLAHTIAGNPSAVRQVQFHASYQYEDFMQGYAPDEAGNFQLTDRLFPSVCRAAAQDEGTTHVILIDEFSRCDVARVFGEALTYLEVDKRGRSFELASGAVLVVPSNLVILATMNPWDKGVDELDVALERRFAQIEVRPDPSALRRMLAARGASAEFVDRLVTFFESVQRLDEETVHLGHAYFANCVDEASSALAWEFRLLPFFGKACRLDREMLATIKRLWMKVVPLAAAPMAGEALSEEPAAAPAAEVVIPAQA